MFSLNAIIIEAKRYDMRYYGEVMRLKLEMDSKKITFPMQNSVEILL